jgi:hypothetical protein
MSGVRWTHRDEAVDADIDDGDIDADAGVPIYGWAALSPAGGLLVTGGCV